MARKQLTLIPRTAADIDRVLPSRLNPRRHLDPQAEADLRTSIQEFGMLVRPIAREVIHLGEIHLEVVAGERRLRAAKALGWKTLPVMVAKELKNNDALALEVAAYDNIDRVELNPYEETLALLQILGARLIQANKTAKGNDPVQFATDFLSATPTTTKRAKRP